ncbi:MAG: hypothetical protein ABSD68_02730 [Candidatus Micrarchaeales archaeon]
MFNYESAEGRQISPNEVRDYINTRKLRWGTRVKGPIEFAIKKVLLDQSPMIDSYYHIFPFTTDDLTWHRPDFLVPQIKVDRKFLILNPHYFRMDHEKNVLDSDIIIWTGFQKLWGHQFHNVLINSYSEKELLRQTGARDVKEFASDSWMLPNHRRHMKQMIPFIAGKFKEVFRGNNVTYDKACPTDELICCLQRAQRIRDLQMEFIATNEKLKAAS